MLAFISDVVIFCHSYLFSLQIALFQFFLGCKWSADTSSTVSIASSIETVVTFKDFNWLNRKEKEEKEIFTAEEKYIASIFFQHDLYFLPQCPFHSASIQCFPNCHVDTWVQCWACAAACPE